MEVNWGVVGTGNDGHGIDGVVGRGVGEGKG